MSSLPSYEDLGGDSTGVKVMDLLFQDYAEAGQAPNSGMGAWFFRTTYDAVAWSFQGMDPNAAIEASIHKHRAEWRAELGLPPIHHDEAPEAPRTYSGNLCGVRVPGLPPVYGGAPEKPTLVLSWFYDRYNDSDRARIRDNWMQQGYTDVLLSWPDSRSVGRTPNDFAATCMELVDAGFFPTVFLLSKDFDPHYNVQGCLNNIAPVMPWLLSPRRASRICIGFELSLWLSPTDVQQLTDAIVPQCLQAGIKTYVHFQAGYASFQQDGHSFADYWNANVGKLTGLMHQANADWSIDELQSRYNDILVRFAGQFNCSPDSGFGHPFDCIALELTATKQFNSAMTEEQGNVVGTAAIQSPTATGPFGVVRVMGSGNGSV